MAGSETGLGVVDRASGQSTDGVHNRGFAFLGPSGKGMESLRL
jgi:hypothetical protein